MEKRFIIAIAAVVITASVAMNAKHASAPTATHPSAPEAASGDDRPAVGPDATESSNAPLAEPLPNALSRVTKKTFGLHVTPKDSPVTPEKFSGYHCGVDFETTPEEADVDVVVRAVCDGPLAVKRTATGYGGVAVQRCVLDGSDVTVIYGHLRLASITPKIGDELSRGQFIGLLGTGFSKETDGERKHLHLGIHTGTAITVAGYVQSKAALADWRDALPLLK